MKFARYFVTICTKNRRNGLTGSDCVHAIREAWQETHANNDARTLGAVIMPDHIHWLFQLGDRLSLTRVMAKFKSRTRQALAAQDAEWETNYWEHRLRPDDLCEDFGIYLFMNPYRAGLVSPDESWPHAWWPDDFRFEFIASLRPGGLPPVSWIPEKQRPPGWCKTGEA